MCMAGPACYWLIDEGEEKDSVFKKRERIDKERQTVEKTESINLVPSAFVYLVNSCGSCCWWGPNGSE